MARLHHATAKRAADQQVTMAHDDDTNLWTATTGDHEWSHTRGATALDAALFSRMCASEYPALTLHAVARGWEVRATNEAGEAVVLWNGEDVPTADDLGAIVVAADEAGIDPHEGYEDEDEQATGSVVAAHYKRLYAEQGHPGNNGDWLAATLAGMALVRMEGKKTVTDVDAFHRLFEDNGIATEDYRFGNAYHNPAARTNGWEGRFRMSGGNVLRKRVADNGFLMAFGDKLEAPEEFCSAHRTKPKKAKAKKAEAEAPEAEQVGA